MEHVGRTGPRPGTKQLPERSTLEARRFRRRFCIHIYKNLVVLSVSFLLVFTASFLIATIQSSLHPEGGLGMASLSVYGAAATLQALFFNALTIRRLGLKVSMLVGMVFLGTYIAFNAYPRWYTLIPTGFVWGLGYALMRTAESSYIARLSVIYATQMDLSPDAIKSRFFAIYYVFYCSARVLGNVASSLILGSDNGFSISSADMAKAVAANSGGCGADYCDIGAFGNASHTLATTLTTTDAYHVYYLCIFCIGCLLLAFLLMVVFLDSLERLSARRYGVNIVVPTESEATPHSWIDLLATLRTWRNPQQLLLLPLCFYNGMDNAFWQADFAKVMGLLWVGHI